MLPKKIIMENFGPFVHEEVDFDELTEAPLFLISGKPVLVRPQFLTRSPLLYMAMHLAVFVHQTRFDPPLLSQLKKLGCSSFSSTKEESILLNVGRSRP